MEDTQIVLERHEQKIQTMERDISDLKAVQIITIFLNHVDKLLIALRSHFYS